MTILQFLRMVRMIISQSLILKSKFTKLMFSRVRCQRLLRMLSKFDCSSCCTKTDTKQANKQACYCVENYLNLFGAAQPFDKSLSLPKPSHVLR